MPRYFAILVICILYYSIGSFAQKSVSDYYYETKEVHGLFHIRLRPDKTFEYCVYRGRGVGNSYSFGKILINGDKHILKSKLNNFGVSLICDTSYSIDTGKLLIKPIYYNDSTFEYGAYLIIDNDTLNKRYIHAEEGVLIKANFRTLKIQIREVFFTKTIYKKNISGNEISIQINTPFMPNDFLFVVNNNYFTIPYRNQIKMFDEKGKFMFAMIKKE